MRILHLSKHYPPDPGGLEYVVGALAEGAAARGHEVRVVCAAGGGREGDRRTTESPRMGVAVVRLPTHGVVFSQPLVRGYLAASRWPADVVYVHRPHPLADVAALWGPERPVVLLHHSDVQRQRVGGAALRPLARAVARRARAVVVASESHLRFARDLGAGGRRKARVIPFGVDHRHFTPGAPHRRPAEFGVEGPVGLFVGRLVGYKGLDVLVRAVRGTDLRMVIVGTGPERGQLESMVSRSGLGERVVFAGAVTAERLPDYYRAANYFVLPSTTPAEMFGIAMVEAMAAGTPPISTALSTGVREVNVADETGLVVPVGDHQALRRAMERLANDAMLRSRLGVSARRRVEECYTADRMVERHIGMCLELSDRRVG